MSKLELVASAISSMINVPVKTYEECLANGWKKIPPGQFLDIRRIHESSLNRYGGYEHSGHAYVTMSIILLITYISQNLTTNILATIKPILMKFDSLDSSYRDKLNGSIFIKFESLDAKIFAILNFYYELSPQLIDFGENDVCKAGI